MLNGREIVLFYDNDPATKKFAGQEHAQNVALSLIRARCRVRIVDLPEGKDISDFLSLGFRKTDLDKLVQDAPYRDEKSVHAWRASFERAPGELAADVGGSGETPDAPAFALTEYGNAERLMRDCAGDARYCRAFKQWYVYDGTRYCPDTTGEMVRRAKKMIRSIPEGSGGLQPNSDSTETAGWCGEYLIRA